MARVALLLMATALLAGCVSGTIQRKQLPLLHKGMSEAQVQDLVKQPPLCTVRFDAVGEPRMQVYRVLPASRSTYYLMLFEFKRLAYWGFRNEFVVPTRPELAAFAAGAGREVAAGRCDGQRILDAR